jgi:lipoate-protein ligase A
LISDSGEKLAGSAQRRREGTILQQTSIRHLPDDGESLRIFKGPHGQSTFPLKKIGVEKLEKALRKGFEKALGIQLTESSLAGWELERAGVLLEQAREGKLVDSRTSL